MSKELIQQIEEITQFLKARIKHKPEIGITLGSGLGDLVNSLTDKITIPYHEIPHIPKTTAKGHAGNLICGILGNKAVLAMQGRFHIYEGHSPYIATILIRVMKKLGIHTLIITCACGSLNPNILPGEIVLIKDHINFSGINPLVGENLDEFGPRFPGVFDLYTPKLQELTHQVAKKLELNLKNGTYAAILGPSYATRSELAMYINNKCDVIGMSLVQESLVAGHSQMQVLALAAITDSALPHADTHATHDEIVESGARIAKNLQLIVSQVISAI